MSEADTEPSDVTFSRKLKRTTYSPAASLILLVCGLLALVGYMLFTLWRVDNTNQVIEKALYAEKLLLDLQTATRGYYLTDDPTLLRPYREGQPELPTALGELRDAVSNDPAQADLAKAIEAGSLKWLAWVNDVVALVKDELVNQPSTRSLRKENVQFDSLRDDLARFLSVEYQRRDARSRKATRSVWILLIVGAAATTVVATLQCRGMRRQMHALADTYRSVLRLAKERRSRAHELLQQLDSELQAVGEMQRSLLPMQLPAIPGLDIAAGYQTSRRAGGDYYDFFRLPPEHSDDERVRYGILIADVSGHGSAAAVLMAVTHSIAHGFDKPTGPPCELLEFVNRRLYESYTADRGAFVTAFYAIYDSNTRELDYSSAGHNPPRLRRAGGNSFQPLGDAQGLPLGIIGDEKYPTAKRVLETGDTVVLYTDGIIEARNAENDMFGVERLDATVQSALDKTSDTMLQHTLTTLHDFAGDLPADDRTLLLLRVCDICDQQEGDLVPVAKETVVVETPLDPLAALRG
jgi:serine phosphatase RsbU (regulator of sigma subunit)